MIGSLLVCAVLAGCRAEESQPATPTDAPEVFRVAESPAGLGSGEPGLFRIGDRPALSWVEEREDGVASLRFAEWEGTGWSEGRTVAEGDDWFVNWADRPGVVSLGGDALAAHYLVKHGDDNPYAYDIRLVRSDDGGQTWSAPITPHRDGTPTEHGFVSAVPQPDGSLLVAWLDGRAYHQVQEAATEEEDGSKDEMSLRAATLTPDGDLTDEVQLDSRTCDCCPTAAASVPDGTLVAYRDRTGAEIRDIAVVRRRDGLWSAPALVHDDGWEIAGCPVNGPALASRGETVALAWFTAADAPHVNVAFSSDAGEHFGPPVTVSGDRPLGRVDAVLLDDGSALVSWIEQVGETAELRVWHVGSDGALGVPITVTTISAERAAGVPRMMRDGETVLVAWTDAVERTQVRVASARLADLTRPGPPEGSAP